MSYGAMKEQAKGRHGHGSTQVKRMIRCEHRLREEIPQKPTTEGCYSFGQNRIAVKTTIVCLPTRNMKTTAASMDCAMHTRLFISHGEVQYTFVDRRI
jgi:hypothetical protein